MNHKKITMIMIVVLIASISTGLILSDKSDASVSMGEISSSGFTTSGEGTVTIIMSNDEDRDISVSITASNKDTGIAYKVTNVNIPANSESHQAKISFNISQEGQHNVKIKCESTDAEFSGLDEKTIIIDVTTSLWSNWTTYVVIIAIVILIAVAAALKLRGAPTVKADTTFTQIESERNSGDNSSNVPASSVERRKYRSAEPESKPKGTAPVKESKPSFTELSKQKTEPVKESKPYFPGLGKKKEEPAKNAASSFTELSKQKPEPKKKEEPGSEPKKLKYVSSRRK